MLCQSLPISMFEVILAASSKDTNIWEVEFTPEGPLRFQWDFHIAAALNNQVLNWPQVH